MGNTQKKALVTGALGHTGTYLVKSLVEKGWKVTATDLESSRRKQIMNKETIFSDKLKYMSIDLPGVTFIAADLTDKESLKALFTPEIKDYDVIFHPASLYDYFAELDILRKINVEGLRNLLDTIKTTYGDNTKNIRFIHWSTCGVYGQPKYKKNEKGFPLPGDENAEYDPPNNYSISKMEQEKVLLEFASKTGLKYSIIRPMPIYGPYQTYGMFHIFYLAHKMGNMPLPIIFPAKKKLMMPMVHVEDLANAAIFIAEKDEAIGQAYNVGDDNVTQQDWLEFIFQELGINYTHVPIWFPVYNLFAKLILWYEKKETKKARKYGIRPKVDVPMIEYIVHQYYFTNKKLRDLGFKFKYDGNPYEGTRETIQWYINNGWFEHEKFTILDERWLSSSEIRKKEAI